MNDLIKEFKEDPIGFCKEVVGVLFLAVMFYVLTVLMFCM